MRYTSLRPSPSPRPLPGSSHTTLAWRRRRGQQDSPSKSLGSQVARTSRCVQLRGRAGGAPHRRTRAARAPRGRSGPPFRPSTTWGGRRVRRRDERRHERGLSVPRGGALARARGRRGRRAVPGHLPRRAGARPSPRYAGLLGEFEGDRVHAAVPDREAAADRLLSVFEPGDMAFHSHEDTFDRPEGSVLLAAGEHVKLQALRRGEAAWGLRFHFEVDAAEVELWLQGAGDGLKEAWGKSADEIRGRSLGISRRRRRRPGRSCAGSPAWFGRRRRRPQPDEALAVQTP